MYVIKMSGVALAHGVRRMRLTSCTHAVVCMQHFVELKPAPCSVMPLIIAYSMLRMASGLSFEMPALLLQVISVNCYECPE